MGLLVSVSVVLLIVSLTSITMACFMCQYYRRKVKSNKVCVFAFVCVSGTHFHGCNPITLTIDVTWEAQRPYQPSYGPVDIPVWKTRLTPEPFTALLNSM